MSLAEVEAFAVSLTPSRTHAFPMHSTRFFSAGRQKTAAIAGHILSYPDTSCRVFTAGRVPKTVAITSYLRALQEREPQWRERIEQVPQDSQELLRCFGFPVLGSPDGPIPSHPKH